ncbi:AbrB/MazE/SpoVT family DNA-binding domain-containing protein [Metallosphaera tengchongensis]|uniref:AbrB/MazE/SpoVT family DNA-binding domain-containing protein n=1 Tax=Metallosphaera tengchongensis TaxID=1532350 RepID=A0A6N0NVM5_9CREN|nr:AbrB/MazE/SpoVT family DNA-binding domain-containing protein [Metallosphaera tengchongensis]QKR00886.1 AbrB/MazE/SpoVT family DNA-binding domain-containing protein [Metallosphaera tengchongensis]
MVKVIRVGRKYAIYLPKEIVEDMNIKEGDLLMVVKEGDKVSLMPLRRPEKYWTEVTPEEVEEVGEEITRSLGVDS